jgi:hypothetical protein
MAAALMATVWLLLGITSSSPRFVAEPTELEVRANTTLLQLLHDVDVARWRSALTVDGHRPLHVRGLAWSRRVEGTPSGSLSLSLSISHARCLYLALSLTHTRTVAVQVARGNPGFFRRLFTVQDALTIVDSQPLMYQKHLNLVSQGETVRRLSCRPMCCAVCVGQALRRVGQVFQTMDRPAAFEDLGNAVQSHRSTVVMKQAHRRHGRLKDLVQMLEYVCGLLRVQPFNPAPFPSIQGPAPLNRMPWQEIKFHVSINVYLSPPRAQGFILHRWVSPGFRALCE